MKQPCPGISENGDEVFTFRDAIALDGASPIAQVTDYDLEKVRV